jgi:hypothetical protein
MPTSIVGCFDYSIAVSEIYKLSLCLPANLLEPGPRSGKFAVFGLSSPYNSLNAVIREAFWARFAA